MADFTDMKLEKSVYVNSTFYGHITQFVKHHTCSDRKLELWNVSLDVLINENEFSSCNYQLDAENK